MLSINTDKGKAILYKGRTLWDVPKTWKKIEILEHGIGNNYNSHLLTLFKAIDGSLRYEIYRDGYFEAFYGRFEFANKANRKE